MKLPNRLTAEELRVLQEFRRVGKDTLTEEEIVAIKHPAGSVGISPAQALVGKNYLELDPAEPKYALTPRAKELLAYEPAPDVPAGAGDTE